MITCFCDRGQRRRDSLQVGRFAESMAGTRGRGHTFFPLVTYFLLIPHVRTFPESSNWPGQRGRETYCSLCDSADHVAKNCPELHCYGCNQQGHLTKVTKAVSPPHFPLLLYRYSVRDTFTGVFKLENIPGGGGVITPNVIGGGGGWSNMKMGMSKRGISERKR
jgi:hypothetical protein